MIPKRVYANKEVNIEVGDYTLVKQASADSGFASTYYLTKNGTQIGEKINIPKDMVVQSGSVKTVATANNPVSGYKVGDKYIDLVLANATNSHIYILVSDLIDTYTEGTAIIITNNQISVDINAKLKPMIDEFIKGKRNNEPLFTSIRKNRFDRTTAYYVIKDACIEAGLQERVGTHTMRKTFGYHHYQQFKDVVLLQKIFNHSTPQITLRYIGVEQDEIDDSYKNFIL